MSPIQELLESIESDQKAFRRANKEMSRVFQEWQQLRDDSLESIQDLEQEMRQSLDTFQQNTRLSLQTDQEVWQEEWTDRQERLLRKAQSQLQLQQKQHQELQKSLQEAKLAYESLHEKQERSRSRFVDWSSQIHELIHERVKVLEEAYKRMKQRQKEEERVLRVEWEEWAKHQHTSLREEQTKLQQDQREASFKQSEFAALIKKAQRNLETENKRNFMMIAGACIVSGLSFLGMVIMLFKG
jgi:hypothetical protein